MGKKGEKKTIPTMRKKGKETRFFYKKRKRSKGIHSSGRKEKREGQKEGRRCILGCNLFHRGKKREGKRLSTKKKNEQQPPRKEEKGEGGPRKERGNTFEKGGGEKKARSVEAKRSEKKNGLLLGGEKRGKAGRYKNKSASFRKKS